MSTRARESSLRMPACFLPISPTPFACSPRVHTFLHTIRCYVASSRTPLVFWKTCVHALIHAGHHPGCPHLALLSVNYWPGRLIFTCGLDAPGVVRALTQPGAIPRQAEHDDQGTGGPGFEVMTGSHEHDAHDVMRATRSRRRPGESRISGYFALSPTSRSGRRRCRETSLASDRLVHL